MITALLLFIQGICLVVIAPLLMGCMKKVKCAMQLKKSPPITQPYFVLRKQLIKQPVVAHNASWLFRAVPYSYFSILAFLCFSLPFFFIQVATQHQIDMIVFVGLLVFARLLIVLGALDVGTAFGSLGARRELLISCCAEPILFVVFYNVALLSHQVYFGDSIAHFIHHFVLAPSLLFSLLAFVFITLSESGRIPFDNPDTHLELTMVHEAMLLEYSGRYLALFDWGHAIQLTIYLTLIGSIFIPFGISTTLHFTHFIFSASIAIVKLLLLGSLIAFAESLQCRVRLFKIPEYLVTAFTLSVLGVLVTQLLGSAI